MKKYSFILIILSLLSGCTKVKINSDFSKLQKKALASTGSTVILDNQLYFDLADMPTIKDTLDHAISRDEAVSIALHNNPELQADFQNLGIAKADLVQAGLYTNPNINSVFRIPVRTQGPGTGQTNIESVAHVRLSDLWQVPLTKHVAQDLLEIVSLRIFSTILTTVAETKIAYDTCLATELQVKNTKDLLEITQELRNEIYYRQLYGYTSDLDKDLVDARLSNLESEFEQRKADLINAYIHLKKLMGLTPSSMPITLLDKLHQERFIPELKIMEDYALANRPEIQIACMKIRQYKDTIKLEKAKIFNVVDIGVAYKQDFDKPFRGWGPYFNISLPIFDTNYAQVARAEFLLKQAKQELIVEKIRILEELNKPYNSLKALEKEITLYKNNVLPSYQKAIEYAYNYAATMQVTMVTALESKIKLYEANSQLIDKYYHARKEFAQLERALGKNITLFNQESNNVA
jgi:outer membrane protein TolC